MRSQRTRDSADTYHLVLNVLVVSMLVVSAFGGGVFAQSADPTPVPTPDDGSPTATSSPTETGTEAPVPTSSPSPTPTATATATPTATTTTTPVDSAPTATATVTPGTATPTETQVPTTTSSPTPAASRTETVTLTPGAPQVTFDSQATSDSSPSAVELSSVTRYRELHDQDTERVYSVPDGVAPVEAAVPPGEYTLVKYVQGSVRDRSLITIPDDEERQAGQTSLGETAATGTEADRISALVGRDGYDDVSYPTSSTVEVWLTATDLSGDVDRPVPNANLTVRISGPDGLTDQYEVQTGSDGTHVLSYPLDGKPDGQYEVTAEPSDDGVTAYSRGTEFVVGKQSFLFPQLGNVAPLSESVNMSVLTLSGHEPVAGYQPSVRITRPDGSSTTVSGVVTDDTGFADASFTPEQEGIYGVEIEGSSRGYNQIAVGDPVAQVDVNGQSYAEVFTGDPLVISGAARSGGQPYADRQVVVTLYNRSNDSFEQNVTVSTTDGGLLRARLNAPDKIGRYSNYEFRLYTADEDRIYTNDPYLDVRDDFDRDEETAGPSLSFASNDFREIPGTDVYTDAIGPGSSETFRVTLRDDAGDPVANRAVDFRVQYSYDFVTRVETVTTNSYGVATLSVTVPATAPRTKQLLVEASAVHDGTTVTADARRSIRRYAWDADYSEYSVDRGQTIGYRMSGVEVLTGDPAVGLPVSAAFSSYQGFATGSFATGSTRTDTDGNADFTLTVPSRQVGYRVSAADYAPGARRSYLTTEVNPFDVDFVVPEGSDRVQAGETVEFSLTSDLDRPVTGVVTIVKDDAVYPGGARVLYDGTVSTGELVTFAVPDDVLDDSRYEVRVTAATDDGAVTYEYGAFVVDSSVTDIPGVDDETLDVPNEYDSIQAAVDAASPGDTIAVAPGVYTESVRVDKSVTITGRPDVPGQPILDGGQTRETGFDLAAGVSGVTIEGFEIREYVWSGIQAMDGDTADIVIRDNEIHRTGPFAVRANPDVESVHRDWTVRNNSVDYVGRTGILLNGVREVTASDNTVTAREDVPWWGSGSKYWLDTTTLYGIAAGENADSPVQTGPATVRDNRLVGPFDQAAVSVYLRGPVDFSDGVFESNTITGDSRRGVWLSANADAGSLNGQELGGRSLDVDGSGSNWTAPPSASTVVGTDEVTGSTTAETLNHRSAASVIDDVVIGSNDVRGASRGVVLRPEESSNVSDVTIRDNRIGDNDVGILLDQANGGDHGSAVARGNRIVDNGDGVVIANGITATHVEVTRNVIAGNAGSGIRNEDDVTVDAARNYWGTSDGPGGDFSGSGDGVVGNVDVRPYYADEELTTLSGDLGPIFRVTSLTAPSTGSVGSPVTYTAEITNVGGEQGTQTIDARFAGVSVDARSLTLNASERRTLAFTTTTEQSGLVDATVATANDTERATVEVVGQSFVNGQSTGDPHITTFGGSSYDFMAAGDFVLAREPQGDLLVVARQAPISDSVSNNNRTATMVGDTRVVVDAESLVPVSVDGRAIRIDPGERVTVDDGAGMITRQGSTYTIYYAGDDGTVTTSDEHLTANIVGDRIDIELSLHPDREAAVEGLLGDVDNEASDDIAFENGTGLSRPLDPDALYGAYRTDWRATGAENLFSEAYFVETFPRSIVTVSDLSDEERRRAEQVLADTCLTPGTPQYRDALLDVALTDDSSYVASACQVDRPDITDATESGTPNFTITSLDVSESVTVGDTIQVRATVKNDGGLGTQSVELRLDTTGDGVLEPTEVQADRSLELGADETETVSLTLRTDSLDPGTYPVGVVIENDTSQTRLTVRPGIDIPSGPEDGETGGGSGDPHLVTFDGVSYDFQAAGEFVFAREPAGDLSVQARLRPVDDRQVSLISAVATSVDGRNITIDARDEVPVSVDGTARQLNASDRLALGDGALFRQGRTYIVVFPGEDGRVDDGDEQLRATVRSDRVDMQLLLGERRSSSVEGLLGSPDGNASNDIALADGTPLERPLSYDALYGQYRDDYRVRATTSLFDYDGDESTQGFYDGRFPAELVSVADLDETERQRAAERARNAGLTPGTEAFEDAVLDYALTDDSSYIGSARVAANETEAAVDATPAVGVRFDNVTAPNGSREVTVDRATFSGGSYYVVVHREQSPGDGVPQLTAPVGVSDRLSEGTHTNVTVDLGRSLADGDDLDALSTNGTRLVAMVHRVESENGALGAPVTLGGGPTTDAASVTVTPNEVPSVRATLQSPVNNVGAPVSVVATAADPDGVVESVTLSGEADGTTTTCDTGQCEVQVTTRPRSSTWDGTGYADRTFTVSVTDSAGVTRDATVSTPVYIAGDVNGDGQVDIFDAVVIGRDWQTSGSGVNATGADLNNDGRVDVFDALLVSRNWQQTAGSERLDSRSRSGIRATTDGEEWTQVRPIVDTDGRIAASKPQAGSGAEHSLVKEQTVRPTWRSAERERCATGCVD